MVFEGELLSGHEPAQVKKDIALLLNWTGSARTNALFNSKTGLITCGATLKQAQHLQSQLSELGMITLIIAEQPKAAKPKPKPKPKPVKAKTAPPQNTKKKTAAALPDRSNAPPNRYELTPYRVTKGVRRRATLAKRGALIAASFCILLLAILIGLQSAEPLPEINPRIDAIAAGQNDNLLVLADDAIHLYQQQSLRLTVSLAALGLSKVHPHIVMKSPRAVLLNAQKINKPSPAAWQLLRCDLLQPACQPLAQLPASTTPYQHAYSPFSSTTTFANVAAARLYLFNAKEQVLAQTAYSLNDDVQLAMNAGLLYLTGSQQNTLSVLRPDANAFGQTLDTIALPIYNKEKTIAMQYCADSLWLLRHEASENRSRLLQFNNDLSLANTYHTATGTQLACHQNNVLVLTKNTLSISRYTGDGSPLPDLIFPALKTHYQTLIEQRQAKLHHRQIGAALVSAAWLAALLTAIALWWSYSVYRTVPLKSAPPMDILSPDTHWLGTDTRRRPQLSRLLLGYTATATALLIGISTLWPAALISLFVWLTAAGIGLWWLRDSYSGNVGIYRDTLILVSPSRHYHIGKTTQLSRCGPFVMLEDVVVYMGLAWLPNLRQNQLNSANRNVIKTIKKVGATTVLTRLIWSRHPMGVALLLIAAATVFIPLSAAF